MSLCYWKEFSSKLPESNKCIAQFAPDNVHSSIGYGETSKEHPDVHRSSRPRQILQPNYPAHCVVLSVPVLPVTLQWCKTYRNSFLSKVLWDAAMG